MKPFPTIGRYLTRSLALVAGVGVADQLSKWYMAERLLTDTNTPLLHWLTHGQDVHFTAASAHSVTLAPFLDFTLVWNRGVSFGLGAGTVAPAAFVAFSALAGILLLVWAARTKQYRFIAWAFVVTLALLMIGHGKSYYSQGIYPVLFAFGAPRLEAWANHLDLEQPALCRASGIRLVQASA